MMKKHKKRSKFSIEVAEIRTIFH